jgi:hypothetical protein
MIHRVMACNSAAKSFSAGIGSVLSNQTGVSCLRNSSVSSTARSSPPHKAETELPLVHLGRPPTHIALHPSLGERLKISRGMAQGSFSHRRIHQTVRLPFTPLANSRPCQFMPMEVTIDQQYLTPAFRPRRSAHGMNLACIFPQHERAITSGGGSGLWPGGTFARPD